MSPLWQSASITQTTEILQKIHAAEPVTRYAPDDALHILPLDFYGSGAWLARAQKQQAANPAQYYVILPAEAIPLDGSVANIHVANAAAPLALSEDNLESYVAFRLYFGDAALLLRLRFDAQAAGWMAHLRQQDKTGTYDIAYGISPRGELNEYSKEKRSDEGFSVLPAFAP